MESSCPLSHTLQGHKNIKQCQYSLQIFVWEIFMFHINVLFMVTCNEWVYYLKINAYL